MTASHYDPYCGRCLRWPPLGPDLKPDNRGWWYYHDGLICPGCQTPDETARWQRTRNLLLQRQQAANN